MLTSNSFLSISGVAVFLFWSLPFSNRTLEVLPNPVTATSTYGPEKLATIALHTPNHGCTTRKSFLDASLYVPAIYSGLSESKVSNDRSAAGYLFQVSAETEAGQSISDWSYYINQMPSQPFRAGCSQTGNSSIDNSSASRASVYLCSSPFVQNVVLKKTDNYLNGVSTYDLTLITKYILGIQPLTGFQLLAADANMSRSVTAIDIVELRKLILGNYTTLPSSNSWRFIDKDLKANVIGSTNPFLIVGGNNPYTNIPTPNSFADEEFDEFTSPPSTNYDDEAKFIGFKVGDVNNTALPSLTSGTTDDRSSTFLTFGSHMIKGKKGSSVEIPVFALGDQALSSWQMALNFDTNLLKISDIRWPTDLKYGQDRGWNLAQPGELRLLWFDATKTEKYAPGQPLFFIRAGFLQNLSPNQTVMWSATNSIPQQAYDENNQQYTIRLERSDLPLLLLPAKSEMMVQPKFKLSAYPNPVGHYFRLEIEASQAADVRLIVYDLLGRELTARSLDLIPGLNTVSSVQLPGLVAGQYMVTLHTPTGVETLRLIKQ